MKRYKIVTALVSLFIASSAVAQIDVKEKVKTETENRVESNIDEGVNKGLDQVENAIGGIFKKGKNKTEKQTKSQEESDTPQKKIQ